MHRVGMIIVLCAVAAGIAWGQKSELLLVVETPPADGLVARDIDWIGVPFVALDSRVLAPAVCLDRDGGPMPLVAQYDPADPRKGRLTVRLPEGTPAGARLRLYPFGNAPEGAAQKAEGVVSVREEGGRAIVNNGFVEVVHDPAAQGGLPSKVTFLDTGKVFEGYLVNDRLYTRNVGQFFIRSDKNAKVRVKAAGPLEVIIEVEARFMAGDRPTATNAHAVYTFRYHAGTPAINVSVQCEQEGTAAWEEYHLMEWNFPGRPLKEWAKGEPFERGRFEEDSKSMVCPQWACLHDGRHVFGIAGGTPRLYSGTTTYGNYVHGPWVSWEPGVSGPLAASTTLWLSAREGTLDRLAKREKGNRAPGRMRLSTPVLEQLRAATAKSIDGLPQGAVRGMCRWQLGQICRTAHWERSLPATASELLALGKAASEKAMPKTQGEAEDGMVLANKRIGLRLAPAADGLSPVSLFGFAEEREFLAEKQIALWEISVEDGEQHATRWTNITPAFTAECSLAANGESARLTWRGTGEAAGLEVAMDLRLDGNMLRLKPAIQNTSATLSVLRTNMPALLLGQIGASGEDDAFLAPTASGVLFPAPLTKGVNCSAVYPSGWGAMQFGAHYDQDGGIYVAAHDPEASTKIYRASHYGAEQAIFLRIEWPVPDATKAGNDFEFPGELAIGVFQGDWFDASRMYRAWVAREAEWWPCRGTWGRPDTPQWMKEVCVWGRPYGSSEQAVPPTLRFAEFMGDIPLAVHWYSWHEIPFDNNYPHYFPAQKGFAEGVAKMQEAGVRVMPYINGRLWDSDTDDFQSVALPAATKKRDGSYIVEHYGGANSQDLVAMCPTQKIWRDTVSEIVLRLLGPECNVDGVYIDQVAAANPVECYDATHGHPLGGGSWWTKGGYWPMLTDLNKKIDETLPEKMLTTECNAGPYTHVFDGYLTWHFQHDNSVPAFAAVYGGKVQMFGRAYNGGDLQAHYARTGQALVFGEQLGWASVTIIDEHPGAAAYLRRCGRIRHALLPYLAWGIMARPPKVAGEIPEVTSDWAWSGKWMVTTSALQRGAWRAEDGSVVFLFANTTDKPLAFTWDFDAAAYGLSGASLKTERISEEGRSQGRALPARSQEAIALEALDVQAVVVRP